MVLMIFLGKDFQDLQLYDQKHFVFLSLLQKIMVLGMYLKSKPKHNINNDKNKDQALT